MAIYLEWNGVAVSICANKGKVNIYKYFGVILDSKSAFKLGNNNELCYESFLNA